MIKRIPPLKKRGNKQTVLQFIWGTNGSGVSIQLGGGYESRVYNVLRRTSTGLSRRCRRERPFARCLRVAAPSGFSRWTRGKRRARRYATEKSEEKQQQQQQQHVKPETTTNHRQQCKCGTQAKNATQKNDMGHRLIARVLELPGENLCPAMSCLKAHTDLGRRCRVWQSSVNGAVFFAKTF